MGELHAHKQNNNNHLSDTRENSFSVYICTKNNIFACYNIASSLCEYKQSSMVVYNVSGVNIAHDVWVGGLVASFWNISWKNHTNYQTILIVILFPRWQQSDQTLSS